MKIRVLDLFCGAGGSSWGALKAGAEIVMGIDSWDQAIASYNENFNNVGRVFSLTATTDPSKFGLKKGEIDLILASPECTNHTCAKGSAIRSEESKRTANYVLKFAETLLPRWIIIENVIHMRNWNGYIPFLKKLNKIGYNYRIEILDSEDFGVHQTRKRLFVICDRKYIPSPINITTINNKPVRDILDINLKTMHDNLPNKPLESPGRAKPTIQRFLRGIGAIGNEVPFLIVYYGSDGSGGWQPLDRPLRTITTIDRFGLVTWINRKPHLRMLQVHELMRAMGFEENDQFVLLGSRRQKIMQLGNGVCPPVMEAIVRHLTSESDVRTQKRVRAVNKTHPGVIR